MDCLFCKILRKEIPAKVVYEDDQALAFEDINPQAPVHVLVIPKKHISRATDISADDEALVGHIIRVGAEIAKQKKIDQSGFRSVFNCNSDAGQEVFHVHLHVLGGRKMSWPPG